MRQAGLVAVAFLGGAVAARQSHATGEREVPYAPLSQLARVLVQVENQYVDPVDRQRLLEGAIKGMVAELDPHSAYMPKREFAMFNEDTGGSFGGIGVEVDFRNGRVVILAPIPGAPAARAGLRGGDELVVVDGKPLASIPAEQIVKRMRGAPGTRVKVSVRRAGEPELLDFELVREQVRLRSVDGRRLTDDVAYLRLRQFQSGTHDELLEAVGALRKASPAPLRAVVLDLRNNPGGLVDEAEAVADELLDGGSIYSTRHRGRVLDEARAHAGGALAGLPVAVLVNEYSASSSELLAGALHDSGKALLVGAPTFGKGSVQTIFELPGGTGLRLTTMRYYTPSGRAIQAEGIRPDIEIRYDDDRDGRLSVQREGDLDGALVAEAPRPEGPAAGGSVGAETGKPEVVAGGKRPDLIRFDEAAIDPERTDDVALRVAWTRVRPAPPRP
ncbi:MAG: S41 family peptidase [Deltaproteobacteria bacterium]|nr:S41 family peptidase [Deltaproteobacteria bacterium]